MCAKFNTVPNFRNVPHENVWFMNYEQSPNSRWQFIWGFQRAQHKNTFTQGCTTGNMVFRVAWDCDVMIINPIYGDPAFEFRAKYLFNQLSARIDRSHRWVRQHTLLSAGLVWWRGGSLLLLNLDTAFRWDRNLFFLEKEVWLSFLFSCVWRDKWLVCLTVTVAFANWKFAHFICYNIEWMLQQSSMIRENQEAAARLSG